MSPRPGEKSEASLGCLMLFFAPFFLAGLAAAAIGAKELIGGNVGEESIAPLLVGLVFMAFPLTILYFVRRSNSKNLALTSRGFDRETWRESPWFPKLKNRKQFPSGVVGLAPETTPMAMFIGLTIVAIFWNGVTWGVFLFALDDDETFVKIFLGIFILVGAGLAIAAIYMLLRLILVGKTSIEIGDEPVTPGQEVPWRLRLAGGYSVNSAVVSLVCRETVRYRQGTNTVTHHEEVYREEIDRRENTDARRNENFMESRFLSPADAVSSFQAANNQIEWALEVKIDIPSRPDVNDRFPFRVAPREET